MNWSVVSDPTTNYANINIELACNYNELSKLYKQLNVKKEGDNKMYLNSCELLNSICNINNVAEKGEKNRVEQEQETLLPEPLYGGAFYDINDNFIYITKVLYNNPATIVFWNDGTKTLSKCTEGDVYNPEMGLALAVLKKITSGDFTANLMKDWLPKDGSKIRTLKEVRKDYNKKKI